MFKRIPPAPEEGQVPFGVEDLYACLLLQEAPEKLGFGRGARLTRRQSRFLFYMIVLNLLKDVLNRVQKLTDN